MSLSLVRRRLRAGLASLAAVAVLALPAAAFAQSSTPPGFADLAAELSPAVVNISTTQKIDRSKRGPSMPQLPPGSPFREFFEEFFEQRPGGQGQGQGEGQGQREVSSLGSGFIVDPAGYVVTNNHVIKKADQITVILNDETKLKAEVVGRDKRTDLAVLKVDAKEKLPAVEWGDSTEARIGDWVLAIGNPFGLGGTVTAGIISARSRDIGAGPYDNFLQTDAAINRGNSGGPLFSTNGKVVGVNTAIVSPSGGNIGISFSIPASLAKPVVEQLIEHGETRRGWLGVRIQQVTPEIAESLGLEEPRGALVAGVTDGGPAESAGIKPGDVILKFDGHKVPEMRELPRIVAQTDVGKTVEVVVYRNGERTKVEAELGRLETAQKKGLLDGDQKQQPSQRDGGKQTAIDALGVALAPLTDRMREEFGLAPDSQGVVVTDVAPNGPAAQKGVRPGDVIVEVNQTKVASPAKVAQQVARAQDQGRKSVLLLINRGGELRFIAVPMAG